MTPARKTPNRKIDGDDAVLLVASRAVPVFAVRLTDLHTALGMSESKVRQLVKRGVIRTYSIDSVVLVSPQDIFDFLEEAQRRQHLDTVEYARERAAS